MWQRIAWESDLWIWGTFMTERCVSWFSCGAASAVAAKLALAERPDTLVVYCEVIEEHPDNNRFLKDCEKWFNREITILGNDKYNRSIYEVFEKTRFLVGPSGARCTRELKKAVREEFEQPGDLQVFGYTAEEQGRFDRLIDANNDINAWPVLIEKGLSKGDCLAMIQNAGIELPVMYKLGYNHNNCIGCVKASGVGYWKKIRQDFPEMFGRMVAMEKLLGRTVCKATINGEKDVRFPLTELPQWIPANDDSPDIQCSIFCQMAEDDYD